MRILLSLAAAATILAIALIILLTPIWTHLALGAAGSAAPDGDPVALNDRTIGDLLTFGSFDFRAADGTSIYTADERGHMRDVQVVLYAFLLLAVASVAFIVVAVRRAPRDAGRWSALARGGAGLVVGVVVLGLFAAFAFDTAFELFHRLLFPGGNFSFPADSNLIREYPESFWELSSAAMGTMAAVGGIATWWFARRRAVTLAHA